jgi:hypothetical protein
MNLAVSISSLTDSNVNDVRAMAAINVILVWMKLFYFLRLFYSTGKDAI